MTEAARGQNKTKTSPLRKDTANIMQTFKKRPGTTTQMNMHYSSLNRLFGCESEVVWVRGSPGGGTGEGRGGGGGGGGGVFCSLCLAWVMRGPRATLKTRAEAAISLILPAAEKS